MIRLIPTNVVNILKEELLDRAQCLSNIKQLCAKNIKAICLSGVDGIGKTTIEKIAFNDTKSMFGASCFIECSESGVDCFTISCKILEQLNEKSKPKDIEEAQDMLNHSL